MVLYMMFEWVTRARGGWDLDIWVVGRLSSSGIGLMRADVRFMVNRQVRSQRRPCTLKCQMGPEKT
eukprot:scaffold201065_cov35-Attheya_sp.AAC.1